MINSSFSSFGLRDLPSWDDPALLDLRHRYAESYSRHADSRAPVWGGAFCAREVDPERFRADNAYLWQSRDGYAGLNPAATYAAYADYLIGVDSLDLLRTLREDGAFGAEVFSHPDLLLVSRDLLDSANELLFLDRSLGVATSDGLRILDIGSGYGRLAYRCATAFSANLSTYVCVDAIPESTYLCDWYTRYRQVDDLVKVVPLDRLEVLKSISFDIAVNVRSFTEMPRQVIESWFDLLDDLHVPSLFIVPNDGSFVGSRDSHRRRHDMLPSLKKRGFRLVVNEPLILDPRVLAIVGRYEHHLLFRR